MLDIFELCLELTNQSTLREISPEYSLKGLMLKLKFQYFGHLVQRTDSFEKTLMLGKREVSGHRVLIKRGPGNRGSTECGTSHEATSGMSS